MSKEEVISVDNPDLALGVLLIERDRRKKYVWKGKDRMYPVSEMTDEHLDNTINMLFRLRDERDIVLGNKWEDSWRND